MFAIPRSTLLRKLQSFLDQDVFAGDVSSAVIPPQSEIKAQIVAKSSSIIAGAEEAALLFEADEIAAIQQHADGTAIAAGEILFHLNGNARSILMLERTVLNILMKMSSIATSTRDCVNQVQSAGLHTIIAATRKVTPGFGWFEKKAVALGGGDPHRWTLSDMVMFKSSHLAFYQQNIQTLFAEARKKVSFSKKIEIEIEKIDDIPTAVAAGADIIMLDNMPPTLIQQALQLLPQAPHKKIFVEASGNITPSNLLDYARTGVDVISSSSMILHPHKIADFSLRII